MSSKNKLAMLWPMWQIVWGMPQTSIGFVLSRTWFRTNERTKIKNEHVIFWQRNQGLSLGLFVFLPERLRDTVDEKNTLFIHEFGHAVQSAILGPLYLFLIGIPSALWANLHVFEKRRIKNNVSYYDFFIEKNATDLGKRFLGQ